MQKIRYKSSMKNAMWKTLLISLGAFGMASCTLGPDFMRPFTKAETINSYINSPENDSAQSMGRWWEDIDDPHLDEYVDQLLSENLQLKQAGERVIQAQTRVRSARGSYYPTIGANASGARNFTPGQSGSSFDEFLSSDRRYATSYNAELQSAWEIDLFGRIRRSTESADAAYKASLFDKEALTHSLIAELLTSRVAVGVNKRLLELAQQNVTNRTQFYDIVKRRYDLGSETVSASDVFLAEESLRNVQADIHEFERLLAEESYGIDVLLGQLPGTTDPFASAFPMLPPPMEVAVCLPADLLDRRPDLRASELRVKAANADIGVAIADLYPSISLSGALGFSGESVNGLFTSDQLAGSLIGQITARIFEGGRLRANIALQESEARELAAAYAEDILNAVRDVEVALKAEKELARQLQSALMSVSALRKAETISKDRFSRGIESLQDVLNTQQRRYTSEQIYYRLQQQRWNARIALYLALGGDWLNDQGAPMCNNQAQTEEL